MKKLPKEAFQSDLWEVWLLFDGFSNLSIYYEYVNLRPSGSNMDTDEESPMDDLVKLTSRMRAAYSPWQEDRSYGLMQCYLATVAAMHAYNYLEILGGLVVWQFNYETFI